MANIKEKEKFIFTFKETCTKDEIVLYLNLQFSFLTTKVKNNKIDFLAFYNYVNYPLPISEKLFKTISLGKGELTKERFINGFVTIYQSNIKEKIQLLIKLFDFDNNGIIHYKDILHLIIHFHYYTQSNKITDLIAHFNKIFENHTKFTSVELTTFMENQPDVFYFFYIYFTYRKPFESASVTYYHDVIMKKSRCSLSNHSSFVPTLIFLPSDFIYTYFKNTSDQQINSHKNVDDEYNKEEGNGLEILNDFERDICSMKAKVNYSVLGLSLLKFQEFKISPKHIYKAQNTKLLKVPTLPKYRNSIDCFKLYSSSFLPIINPNTPKIFGYILDNETQFFIKIYINIIGNDIYVLTIPSSDKISEELYCFISMKHLFTNNDADIKEYKIKGNDNDTFISSLHPIKLISQLNNPQKEFIFAFETMKEAYSFKEMIHKKTSYYDFKDYYIEKKLVNHGSFGMIYIVEHIATHKIYALKKLFKQKNSDMATLIAYKYEEYILGLFVNTSHPGISKCYETYEDEEALYIITEYYEEGTLQDFFDLHDQCLDLDTIEMILKDLSLAVKFMHQYGIIHRDLKTNNILLLKGHPIIIDFGLSTIIGKYETLHQRCGTPAYYAPEIIVNYPYNHSIDIWCVGVIGYYLLYGKFHFENESYKSDYTEMATSIIKEDFVFPKRKDSKTNDDQLRAFLMKCLEKKSVFRIHFV